MLEREISISTGTRRTPGFGSLGRRLWLEERQKREEEVSGEEMERWLLVGRRRKRRVVLRGRREEEEEVLVMGSVEERKSWSERLLLIPSVPHLERSVQVV